MPEQDSRSVVYRKRIRPRHASIAFKAPWVGLLPAGLLEVIYTEACCCVCRGAEAQSGEELRCADPLGGDGPGGQRQQLEGQGGQEGATQCRTASAAALQGTEAWEVQPAALRHVRWANSIMCCAGAFVVSGAASRAPTPRKLCHAVSVVDIEELCCGLFAAQRARTVGKCRLQQLDQVDMLHLDWALCAFMAFWGATNNRAWPAAVDSVTLTF